MAACCTPTSEINNESEMVTLFIVSSMRASFTIQMPELSAARDIHLEISRKTSLSRSFFKLATDSKELPDNLSPMADFGVQHGTKIYLNVSVESGILRNKVTKLNSAQKTIRQHVYQMKPEEVSAFFDAEHTVYIRLMLPTGIIGRLKFRLDRPLSSDPDFYATALERVFDKGQSGRIHSLHKTSTSNYKGKFHGDLSPDVFNSRGVPGRTVDTLVCILDNLLSMVNKS